jgi:HAD superfamily hydrolase (TIGR01509 family)
MIEAIIFDCFGVLATDGWLPFKRKYFGHDHGLTQRATNLNKKVDAGLASYDDFITEMAQMAKITPKEALQAIENVPNEPLFAYIKELKTTCKIGLLSNAGANWLNHIFTDEQVALFDAVALSYETGYIKPRPEAYNAITERLGVPSEACVFIDDQPSYGQGATELGMHFIVYKDAEQVERDLRVLLADSKK